MWEKHRYSSGNRCGIWFSNRMEDIPTRNIYKDDIHYNIIVNNNGTFDRSYCYPVEIESTISYAGTDYTWNRTKISSRTMISQKNILKVSRGSYKQYGTQDTTSD